MRTNANIAISNGQRSLRIIINGKGRPDRSFQTPWQAMLLVGSGKPVSQAAHALSNDDNGDQRQYKEQYTQNNRYPKQKALDAAPGTYVVGFIVEDLDGGRSQVFELVEVR